MGKGFHRISKIIFLAAMTTACSNNFSASEEEFALRVEDSLGCPNFQSEAFNAVYAYLDGEKSSPNFSRIRDLLDEKITAIPVASGQEGVRKQLINELSSLFKLFTTDTENTFAPEDWLAHLQHIIEYEMGDISTQANIEFSNQVQLRMEKIKQLSETLELECENPPPRETPPPAAPPPVQEQRMPASLFGGHFAMANAYQSCQALRLPPISASTDNVKGVVRGKKVDSVGYGREYTNIFDIQNTHYYIQGVSYGESCFSVKDRPLVYDYGGQPSISSQKLNFFVNSGGGSALGVDCSAFVSSALATAGLRYSPKLDNKPIYIRQNSRKFIDPVASGWKCFDRIQLEPQQSILPGDIMSIPGHVVMIDEVGEDPFGIRNASTEQDCNVLNHKNFNFVILQSSPSKNSIGINRYLARDYLDESSGMRSGFLAYAKSACLAKVRGQKQKLASGSHSIIRHKDSLECRDNRVSMVNESCIAQCPELN